MNSSFPQLDLHMSHATLKQAMAVGFFCGNNKWGDPSPMNSQSIATSVWAGLFRSVPSFDMTMTKILRGNVWENQRGAPTCRRNLLLYSGHWKYSWMESWICPSLVTGAPKDERRLLRQVGGPRSDFLRHYLLNLVLCDVAHLQIHKLLENVIKRSCLHNPVRYHWYNSSIFSLVSFCSEFIPRIASCNLNGRFLLGPDLFKFPDWLLGILNGS